MININPLELRSEKQAKFWANTFGEPHKGVVTSAPLYALTANFVGRKVIDVGAADGSLIRHIKAQAGPDCEVIGVDLAPKSADVLQADCKKLPFGDGAFDTAYMTDVAEHLSSSDLELGLQEAFRVLKPGGAYNYRDAE